MNSFIDTHAHLRCDIDWRVMDEIAESGLLKQAWLMHCPVPAHGYASEDEVLACAERYPGMYVPFGFIDFSKGTDEVARLKDKGFVGLKAISPVRDYDAEEHFPIYAKAQELGMPILFHVGVILRGFGNALECKGFPGPTKMKPVMLDTISDAFPSLKLIQGHMGVPWVNELWESIYFYPNVSCSVCGLIDYEWLIQKLGCKCSNGTPFTRKMMFGADCFYGDRDSWNEVKESAYFMELFFRKAGRTFDWGNSCRDFMENNAAKFIASDK